VSDVLTSLRAATPDLAVSIAGDPNVPFRVMAGLQRELQEAGTLRVIFGVTAGDLARGYQRPRQDGRGGRGLRVEEDVRENVA
jgi:hypothetical protein